ncbi:hypothetical protein NKG94_06855 [Micromonospora sp. M12]
MGRDHPAGVRAHPRLRRLPGEGRLGGQPGPFTYGRDHADGANLLAEALARTGCGALAGVRLQPPPGLAGPVHRPGPGRVRPLCPAGRPVPHQRGGPGEVRPGGLPAARAGLAGARGDAGDPAGRGVAGHPGVHGPAAARLPPRPVVE